MKKSPDQPLYSMTGYAAENTDLPTGQISLELRAVNSRFLDLSFRMGEDFRALEPRLRERIASKVKRGKLECRINFAPRQDAALPASLNTALLAQLTRLAGDAASALPQATPMGITDILRWPGMLGDNTLDIEALHATSLQLIDVALDHFNASRTREGAKLKEVIQERVTGIRAHAERIRPRIPEIVAAYRDKLTKRLEELLPTGDSERIHQEVVLFAQKIDVDEEIDRLLTHLDEVNRVLDAGGATGKRLDFLMQELNREANTLGSKSASLEMTQTSVELKVLIEQIREQVQNLE